MKRENSDDLPDTQIDILVKDTPPEPKDTQGGNTFVEDTPVENIELGDTQIDNTQPPEISKKPKKVRFRPEESFAEPLPPPWKKGGLN
jgi:hypothetical protein